MAENKKKVLIIDDEPSICTLCERILQSQGFETDIVHDGRAAENLIDMNEYNLILADIRLPVESGIDLFIWLKQEHPQAGKRVVFMTGGFLGSGDMTFLEKNGRPYLLKPFRPDELIEKIKEVID